MKPKQPSLHAFFGGKAKVENTPSKRVIDTPAEANETGPEKQDCELSRLKRNRAGKGSSAEIAAGLEDSSDEDSGEPSPECPEPKKTKLLLHDEKDENSAPDPGENDDCNESNVKTETDGKTSINDVLGKHKAKDTGKVDGVGQGAIAAAALHSDFCLESQMKSHKWDAGNAVPYSFLVSAFNEIASQTKRLSIIASLTDVFRCIIKLTQGDLLPAVYLCTSRVAPPYAGKELGIGDAILIRAVAQATGRQEAQIKKEYNETGDLGEVASNSKGKQRTIFKAKPLTIQVVFKQLKDIASVEGHKSQDQKKGMIMKLLAAASDAEAGFLIRCLQGKLRIGLAEQSVLTALAQAIALENLEQSGEKKKLKDDTLANMLESANVAVRQAYGECPSYDILIPALLEHGTTHLLEHVHFKPGIPIKAMLARPTNGVSEVLDKFSECEFTCEYKYDGERAQVHVLEDGTVHIYSRNLENTTTKYPDVAAQVKHALTPGTTSVVLDGEVQAWDTEKNVFLPFQVLTTRKRKDVTEEQIKVQALLHKPLWERREAMHKAIVSQEGQVRFATCKTSKDIDELQGFLDEAVDACTEGLIVKTLADPYEPSKRSLNWLKLKKDYLEGQGDTFDVAVIGAMHGKGKRTGCFGSFLLAVYEPETEEFQTISKIGTGFSEEQIKEFSDQLQQFVVPQMPRYYRVTDKLVPDVWFDAKVVWEVKAADLTVSPVYTAGIGKVDPSKGISIRFPRLVRVREDKTPEETTSPEQIAEMYSRQAVVARSTKPVADDFW